MNLKVINDDATHTRALARLDALMAENPMAGTDESDEIEILAVLLEDYERRAYPADLPSPVDAILFRMEQAGLTQRDLVPYLGSRSKVSEVLSGKRPLSISMIRALSEGLGIPVDVLLREPASRADASGSTARLPVREIISRGWVVPQSGETPEEAVGRWSQTLTSRECLLAARRTGYVRSAKKSDDGSLAAWMMRVVERAGDVPLSMEYESGTVDSAFISLVSKQSVFPDGPLRARDVLLRHGVRMVVEPHLPRTHLDGAAIWADDGPVVALTLRHDRLDNFWFTLAHELAHLCQMESGTDISSFFDDLDSPDRDSLEVEADKVASDSLIPPDVWRDSIARRLRSVDAVTLLASQLGISPAIVAGRVRREYSDYRILSRLIGSGEVRHMFAEAKQ